MRKIKFFTLAFVLLTMFVAVPAHAVLQDMWAYVYKWEGGMNADGTLALTRRTSGITFQVLAHGSDTEETLYYYGGSTALTNTVTTTSFESATICNDRVAFRVDPTDSTDDRYVDLIVTDTVGGFSLFYPHFDKYTHTLVIDERPNIMHHGIIEFTGTTLTVTSTGIYFVADTMIHDVRVEVVHVSSAQTLDVGIQNVGNKGLRVGVLLTTAGYVADTAVITAGGQEDYTPITTYGSFLYTALTGTDISIGNHGGRSYIGYIVTSDVTAGDYLTYTNSGATAHGYLHYWFTRLR